MVANPDAGGFLFEDEFYILARPINGKNTPMHNMGYLKKYLLKIIITYTVGPLLLAIPSYPDVTYYGTAL